MRYRPAITLACLWGIGVFGCLPLGSAQLSYGASSVPYEYEVKAAFLYNFAKFVEWPAETGQAMNNSFVIGIFGDDPFGNDIDELLKDKTIKDRKIWIKRFRSVKDIAPCDILFINPSDIGKLQDILNQLGGSSVLTVSESDEFTRSRAMISFFMQNDLVRFDINKEEAEKAGLRISSQLLKLARVVSGS